MKIMTALLSLSLVTCAGGHVPPVLAPYHHGDIIINNVASPGRHDPVYKSVVRVIDRKNGSTGTAFVFKNIKGHSYILTAQHICLRRGRKLETTSVPDENNETETFFVKTVYTNKEDDVCIARMYDTGHRFLPLSFATERPRTGDRVMMIGASEGVFPTKTDGYVIGHDLLGNDGSSDENTYAKKLLVSAGSANGNSGGPVYNERFELVGMLVANHPEFHHSSLCTHLEAIRYHLKKYFKR